MLIYGDQAERVEPQSRLREFADRRRHLLAMPPGISRHSTLVGLFVDMAGLTQGIADALFAIHGADRHSAALDACITELSCLASAVRCSWDSEFEQMGTLPDLTVTAQLPSRIEIRLPEGFVLYALYPEAYIEAARRLGRRGPFRVIGVRSIGTGLAALAADVLASPPPLTFRPIGHPFDRRLSIAPSLAAELFADPTVTYVVVDEGPGLSGSSFGAVADLLEDRGVPAARLVFLTGHAGEPGSHASARHRRQWASVRREAADRDSWLETQLPRWSAAILGNLATALEDISGGIWRRTSLDGEAHWPAVHPAWERRKFLARSGDGSWLLKFAGLGSFGERKLARARVLHAAGFIPEPRGMVHGFLVERWIEGAAPLNPTTDRSLALLDFVGRYLGLRARLFGVRPDRGAPLEALLGMALFNTIEALGREPAAVLDDWRPTLPQLAARMARVETDNRCVAHEWLTTPDGRLLKTDALDHHAAHDLIGCQDIAWDIVGAALELGLPVDELAARVSAAGGRPVHRELIDFLAPCYLAFRLGWHRLAASALDQWPHEKARNDAAAGQYAMKLERLLHGVPIDELGRG